jgi:hypothetical protein
VSDRVWGWGVLLGYCSVTSVWEPLFGGGFCGAVFRRALRSVSGTMPPYRSIARCMALTS